MQMMKDRTDEKMQRLRFAFHIMEDKKVDYETAHRLINEQFPNIKQDGKSDLESIPLYKYIVANNSLSTIDKNKFRYACLRLLVANSILSNVYWQAIKNLISYSLTIVVASLCVFYIIGLKVLPEFTNVYVDSAYATPEFTRWVVSWSEYYWMAIIIVILITILTVSIAQYFNRQLIKMAPLNKIIYNVIPSNVTYYYHEYLVVQFAIMLVKSGVSTKLALEVMKTRVFAGAASNNRLSGSLSSLELAQKLGVLERELDYQTEQTSENLVAALYKFKVLMNRAVFVVAAVFVGISMVAVYLPIFHFGQVF